MSIVKSIAVSRSSLRALLSASLLVVCALACTSVKPSTPPVTTPLTASDVVSNVRKAVGYDRIQCLQHGFALEEVRIDSGTTPAVTTRMFGRAGEVRQDSSGNTFVFDGRELWMINPTAASSRSGSPYPVNQKQLEKLVIPWWIQSGWWLDPRAPLNITIVPGEPDSRRIVLSVRFKNGVVGSQVIVDRATWLPTAVIVEQAKGPLTLDLGEYRKVLGFNFPQRFTVTYDGSRKAFAVKSVAPLPAQPNRFRELPATDDAVFDNSVPAELKLGRGAPFADGSAGHPTYVRPLVDGRDVGWFHFDTGADNMMIDTRLADELGMPVIGESEAVAADGNVRKVTIRRGRTFQLGRLTIKDPIYLADDLSRMNAPAGEKRAGFCGYPLLVRAIVEVSHGAERIALYDPSRYELARGKWEELALVDYKPAVVAVVPGNARGLFMLDTGHSRTVTINSSFSAHKELLRSQRPVKETVVSSGGNLEMLRGSLPWFELAGHRFEDLQVSFRIAGEGYEAEHVAGVVGRELMRPFTIVFNYPRRLIAFLR